MYTFHWPRCTACCVGSVRTVSSQGCVPRAWCILCALRFMGTSSSLLMPWALCVCTAWEKSFPLSFPGCISLPCMTTSILGECDLRPQGLPIMPQSPQLLPSSPSLGCKPGVPTAILACHELVQKPQPCFSVPADLLSLSPNCISI